MDEKLKLSKIRSFILKELPHLEKEAIIRIEKLEGKDYKAEAKVENILYEIIIGK